MTINWKTGDMAYLWFAHVFAPNQNGHIVKIGKTRNIVARHRQILTGSPYDCWKIWAIQSPVMNGFAIEGLLHRKYRHFKMNREWFCLPTLEVWDFERDVTEIIPQGRMEQVFTGADEIAGYFPSQWPPGYEPPSEAHAA